MGNLPGLFTKTDAAPTAKQKGPGPHPAAIRVPPNLLALCSAPIHIRLRKGAAAERCRWQSSEHTPGIDGAAAGCVDVGSSRVPFRPLSSHVCELEAGGI